MAESYPIVCILHPIYPFICWWHLGCSHFLAVVNNTAVNVGAQVSESLLSSCSSFDYIPNVELLGQMVIAWLCLRTTKLFSTVPSPFYVPTRNVWGIQFLHILADTCYFLLKKKSYPSKCEVAQIYIFKGALRKQYGGWTDGGKSIRQRKQWRDGCWGMGFLSTWPKRVAWAGRAGEGGAYHDTFRRENL